MAESPRTGRLVRRRLVPCERGHGQLEDLLQKGVDGLLCDGADPVGAVVSEAEGAGVARGAELANVAERRVDVRMCRGVNVPLQLRERRGGRTLPGR